MVNHQSEVARLRQRIALEYEAVRRVFADFTPTTRHAYIQARQVNIALCFAELQQHMSPEEAAELVSIAADEDLIPHVEDSLRNGDFEVNTEDTITIPLTEWQQILRQMQELRAQMLELQETTRKQIARIEKRHYDQCSDYTTLPSGW